MIEIIKLINKKLKSLLVNTIKIEGDIMYKSYNQDGSKLSRQPHGNHQHRKLHANEKYIAWD